MNLVSGRLIVTPWKAALGEASAVGCPVCRSWFAVESELVGNVTQCPRCGQMLELTEFTIAGDWRPVARAWAALVPGATA